MLTNSSLLKEHGYVNGQWVGDDANSRFDVTNAYSNEVISSLPDMGKKETDEAIDAANNAWPEWRARTAKDRAGILKKWFDLIMANQEDLAILMTAEQGKPIAEARGEVVYGASFIFWFADEAQSTYGVVISTPANLRSLLVLTQSIGVFASITPWNISIAMITR